MKKILIASVASLITITGGAIALNNNTETTGANPTTPLVAQVENHEERIGDLEVKTDNTQTQVNQNTADISNLQQNTSTAPAEPVEPVKTPVKQVQPIEPEPEPTPIPEPIPTNPRLIVKMTDLIKSETSHICHYWLYDSTIKGSMYNNIDISQPISKPCYKEGEILPLPNDY